MVRIIDLVINYGDIKNDMINLKYNIKLRNDDGRIWIEVKPKKIYLKWLYLVAVIKVIFNIK